MPKIKEINPEIGNIAQNTFGVEIEFVGLDWETAKTALVSAGIPTHWTAAYHYSRRPNVWNLCTDSSVRGGLELVSPILRGSEGLADVAKAAEALSGAGATVNRTCGLHVHVGLTQRVNAKVLRKLCLRWAQFEHYIEDWLFSPSRKGNAQYCRSNLLYFYGSTLKDQIAAAVNKLKASRTVRDIVYAFSPDRYFKLNLQKVTTCNTVEFRGHQGSVDAEKICGYVKLMVNFVSRSETNKEAQGPIAYNTKKYYLAYFCGLNEVSRKWISRRAKELKQQSAQGGRPC